MQCTSCQFRYNPQTTQRQRAARHSKILCVSSQLFPPLEFIRKTEKFVVFIRRTLVNSCTVYQFFTKISLNCQSIPCFHNRELDWYRQRSKKGSRPVCGRDPSYRLYCQVLPSLLSEPLPCVRRLSLLLPQSDQRAVLSRYRSKSSYRQPQFPGLVFRRSSHLHRRDRSCSHQSKR